MGRAKGTRNDHTGEPAPGRGVRPKILEELQEIGGMSPAWHRRNHLVQDTLGEVGVSERSRLLPDLSLADLESLRSERWGYHRRMWLFDLRINTEVDPVEDPLIQALWEQEVLRAKLWLQEMNGPDLPWQEIEPHWKDYASRSIKQGTLFHQPSRVFENSLWLWLLRQGPGSALSYQDRKQLHRALKDFSESPLYRYFAQEELLVPFSQQQNSTPFPLWASDFPPDALLSRNTLSAFLPAVNPRDIDVDAFLENVGGQEIDFNESERNHFQHALLSEVAKIIITDYDLGTLIYPYSSPQTKNAILQKALCEAFEQALYRYIARMSTRYDLEQKMEALCGKEVWNNTRTLIRDSSGQVRISPRPVYRMAEKFIEGSCSLAELIVASIEMP